MPVGRWLLSGLMSGHDGSSRDLARLVVPPVGSLVSTGDPWEPCRLLDAEGAGVDPVTSYLRDLQATGRSTATLRSYGMDLLRWFRFIWAIDVPWSQATRVEARDFSCWIQVTRKRRPVPALAGEGASAGPGRGSPGAPNPVTGKPSPGRTYAAATGPATWRRARMMPPSLLSAEVRVLCVSTAKPASSSQVIIWSCCR